MAESRHDDQQDEQSENQASKDIEGAANQPNMHNKRLGRLGEDVAARYLVSSGYEIIARHARPARRISSRVMMTSWCSPR